jgi:hypothetical protein
VTLIRFPKLQVKHLRPKNRDTGTPRRAYHTSYNADDLKFALDLCRKDDGTSVASAAALYRVPLGTLYDRLQIERGRPGAPTVLSPQEELGFVKCIKVMSNVGVGLTKDDLAPLRARADGRSSTRL